MVKENEAYNWNIFFYDSFKKAIIRAKLLLEEDRMQVSIEIDSHLRLLLKHCSSEKENQGNTKKEKQPSLTSI